MNMQVLDARRDTTGGYKVDVSRGQRVGRVSSEWFSRPADERYLSLSDLARSVRDRADHSRTRVVESALIHVEANRNDPERLTSLTDEEEIEFGTADNAPWLLADTLRKKGAHFEQGRNWGTFVVTDGNLMTGQNPQSSSKLAEAVIGALSAVNPNSSHAA
ncbi:hypothetical protein QOZ99_000906 [Angulomicrobium amanitiforme]|uniref:DUF932 domain-containing protein n=1 Tax=Ancylobacter amanitiformis TaxID=217069 RepID=A0ABU0LMU9_9HYPH|nr:hypothetical protein [Ancylobacter amanitiformis]